MQGTPVILIGVPFFMLSAMVDIVTEHPHVVRASEILGGEPIIVGTRMPVRAVVEMWRSSLSLDEIIARLPHVRLAQVFDALGFFEDHTAEILEHIEKNKMDGRLLNAAISKGVAR